MATSCHFVRVSLSLSPNLNIESYIYNLNYISEHLLHTPPQKMSWLYLAHTKQYISSPGTWQDDLEHAIWCGNLYIPGWFLESFPKDPFVCPKDPGFPQTNPMNWGWDCSTINPTRLGGIWILRIFVYTFAIHDIFWQVRVSWQVG